MLQVQLIGNIGTDAKVMEVNGNKFVSFSVGTNEKFKDSQGNQVEKSTWVSCILSKESPVKDYLKKGTKVFVEGDLSVKTFKNQNGDWQSGVNCRVRKIELLSAKKVEDSNSEESHNQPEAPAGDVEDDLPF